MNRPAARLWAGALVLGVVNQLHSSPVNIRFDSAVSMEAQTPLRVEIAAVGITRPPAVDESASWSIEPARRSADLPAISRIAAGEGSAPLAVPIPAPLWPAAVTLAAVAIGSYIRKHRRR